jgi:hypothetical protein
MTQKTYQQLRQECRALRAAHKKIKLERDKLQAQLDASESARRAFIEKLEPLVSK